MKLLRKHYKLIVLAATCLTLGAGVSAIASAGAATTASGTTAPASGAVKRHHRLLALGAAVQGSLVVHTKSGFQSVTFNRGVVQSVSGQQLTLTERTRKAVYRTVTLTIPTTARVRDNRAVTTLAQVKPGQIAMVVTTPARTFVFARTPRL